jgi:prepilin-type N-terminal cleavage/methylation domain-containing protein
MMKNKLGFTLIEVTLTMSLIAILISLASLGLTSFQQTSTDMAFIDQLVSDIKHQQQKAILGVSSGNDLQRYGVYFKQDAYILFDGDLYNSKNENNIEVDLKSKTEFAEIKLYQNSILFEKGSGDLVHFEEGNNFVTLTNGNKISISKIGVVTTEN